MNFLFKIKHYVKPYFFESFYSCNPKISPNTDVSEKYWIEGYKKNIETGKWKFENGIPMGLYNHKWSGSLAKRTHISALTEYFFALNSVDDLCKKAKIVEFILMNLHEGRCVNGTKYYFWKTFISEHSDEYFVHGMGQGQILSLLTRARIDFPSMVAESSITKVANSYKLSIGEKNAFVNRSDGVIFEEYPHLTDEGKAVLNGWVLSIIGLYDYLHSGFSDPELTNTLEETICTLKAKLNEYDFGYWTLYNLPKSFKNIASAHYHGQHAVFLKTLALLTNDSEILYFAERIERYSKNYLYKILAMKTKVIANIVKYKRLYKTA